MFIPIWGLLLALAAAVLIIVIAYEAGQEDMRQDITDNPEEYL